MIEKSILSLTTRGVHHVAYNEWGRKDRAQTVICVHGLTRNSHDFDALAQALEQDRRVVCPDVVGRGRSDWLADKQQYTFATYCGDMVATIVHNAGIYNGILAAGLFWAALTGESANDVARVLLAGAAIAGIFGTVTMKSVPTAVQAVLGIIGLLII